MSIALLNKRVTLSNPTVTKEADGGTVTTLVSFATVWAGLKVTGSKTSDEGSQKNLIKEGDLTLRYSEAIEASTGINTDVLVEGVHWKIEGIERQDKRFITLKLTTIDNGV